LNPRHELVEKRRLGDTNPQGAQTDQGVKPLSNNNETKPPPTLGPEVREVIGRELRRMYADIIAEGVPVEFAAILRKLDEPRAG
jgi:Anti-sigma factor NepR